MARTPRTALIAFGVCLIAFVATGLIALQWPVAQLHDSATLAGFAAMGGSHAQRIANTVVGFMDPTPYVIITFCFSAIALVRRKPRLALLIPLAMFGATLASETLKPLLAGPRYTQWLGSDGEFLPGSWPSGHATAAMMVGLNAVLVSPRRWRVPAAFAGLSLAVGVSYSVLMLGWHFPSDVFGGFLMSGMSVSLELAVLWWWQDRWPAKSARRAVAQAADSHIGMASALIFGVFVFGVLMAGHGDFRDAYNTARGSFLLGAGGIATLAALLFGAVTTAARER